MLTEWGLTYFEWNGVCWLGGCGCILDGMVYLLDGVGCSLCWMDEWSVLAGWWWMYVG